MKNLGMSPGGAAVYLTKVKKLHAASEKSEEPLEIKTKEKNIHSSTNSVKSLFRQAQHFERLQDILDAEVISLRSAFDVILDNYTTGKTRFLDLQRALEERTAREVHAVENKYLHAKAKLLLARLAGLDDLPGESLENLTEYSAN